MTACLESCRVRRWTVAVLLVGAVGQASAHSTQLSRVALGVEGAVVRAEVQASAFDFGEALAVRDLADPQGRAVASAMHAHAAALAGYLDESLSVLTSHGVRCALGVMKFTAREQYIEAALRWTCPSTATGLNYQSTLFLTVDSTARQIVIAKIAGQSRQTLLDSQNPSWILSHPPTTGEVVGRFLYAGIEHIFRGYDHIAFLLGVILWGRRAWPLVKAVTAFTVAHSLTLALAALDILRLPSALVEAMIAATIVYVAVENYFIRDLDRRWRITGVLGLVHGVGFASVLRAYGLPDEALGWALGAFNLGVEAGQLAIVLVAMSLLLVIDRVVAGDGLPSRSPVLVGTLSTMIGGLGLYWFIARTLPILG